MKDLIKYVPGFMSEQDADFIYAYAKTHNNLFLNYGNGEQEFTVHTYHEIEKNNKSVLDLLQTNAMKVYDYVNFNYNRPFKEFEPLKTHIAKFTTGHGMHEHFDSSRPNDIATLVYINDDYEGGEIYFVDHDISIKPKKGDLIAFPDNPDFIHGVRPIISGTRYTTPRWFTSIV
jgi:hypothetical protein